MKIELAKTEVIHFIGIGGIGMSGLSLIMKGKGFKVQGSDLSSNKNIDRLKKEKIKVFTGQKKQNLKNATIAVISSAIKKNNSEYIEARKKKTSNYYPRKNVSSHCFSYEKYRCSWFTWQDYNYFFDYFNTAKNQIRSNNY